MDNYIFTNSSLILNIILNILDLSDKKKINNICPLCNKNFTYYYIYKNKDLKFEIFEFQIHLFIIHNKINSLFYKKLCSNFINNFDDLNFDKKKLKRYNIKNKEVVKNINWCAFNANEIFILDALYEFGSNKIYTEKNLNINESKIFRFSEHAGLIYFEKNKILNIKIMTKSRVEQSDPLIFMPSNSLEALKVDYIFHTHPKTPFIGSRLKNGILYEFPSISDITHFIEHHNNGKLLGSIIMAPEGIYIIRKNNFNRNPIHVDYNIMIKDLQDIFSECYNDSYSNYSYINYNQHKINNEIKLKDDFFYKEIANNYEYISKINDVLYKYDLFIDYYARILFNNINQKKWVIDNIYLPFIN